MKNKVKNIVSTVLTVYAITYVAYIIYKPMSQFTAALVKSLEGIVYKFVNSMKKILKKGSDN